MKLVGELEGSYQWNTTFKELKIMNKSNNSKRFCFRGHDTFICGRDKKHNCKLCRENRDFDPKLAKLLKDAEICKVLWRDTEVKIRGKAGVYRILCSINNKMYIGSSKDVGGRFNNHKRAFILGKNSPHLQHAWNLHGPVAFKFEIVEFVDSKDLKIIRTREQYWIDYFDSANPEKGYNIEKKTDGSEHPPLSQEQKDKISITLKKKYASGELINAFLGHKHTKEYKKNDSLRAKKWWADKDNKAKMKRIFNSPETRIKKLKILQKARKIQKALHKSKKSI